MTVGQIVASIVGFLCGVGVTAIYYQWQDHQALKKGVERRHRNRFLPTPGKKPEDGKKALVVQDEPDGGVSARQTLIKPSPVPGWLAVILVLLGVGTVASTIVQNQRDAETRQQVRVAQCQNFAQLKFRGDDTRAGYIVLSQAIRKLTDPQAQRTDTLGILNDLADYYESQGQDPGGLPPLSQRAINDCKDGVFNDGYPNRDGPENEAPPASPIPQANIPSSPGG